MQSYDLIVIGSGPAGQRAAIQGAKFGKRVILIERREVVGGVCINTGTIPSKTLREAVLHFSGFLYQGIYGMNYRVKDKVTMADLSFRVQHVIKTEVDVTQAQLSRNNVEVSYGVASFTSPTSVKSREFARRAGVHGAGHRDRHRNQAGGFAQGAHQRPHHHQQRPDHADAGDSADLHRGRRRRDRRRIHLYVRHSGRARDPGGEAPSAAGIRGSEMVEALSYHLRDSRVTMRLNEEVESVEETPTGVVANLQSKKKISADALLYAVGRQGNVDDLNLAAAGIAADSRGRIQVDAEFRTAQPNIFAVGDVIGFPSLASVSMEQGRIAAAKAFGAPVHSNPAFYPYGIYTIPEISFIGKTEEQLTDEDVPYEVGVAYYREIARGQIRGDTTGRLKIIFHRETRKILGVHIIGEGASELLHIGQAVLILDGTIDYFVDTVFNYPTLAECYKAAAFNGINKLSRF